MSQTTSILIRVFLVVLRLSLYSSQSLLWYSNNPCTHHSLSGGTQTIPILDKVSLLVGHQSIPIHITFCLVVLRLTLYASKSLLWYSEYRHTHHSLSGGSDNPYTHHSLPRGTQTIPLLTTVCLVVLRLSVYSSQCHW